MKSPNPKTHSSTLAYQAVNIGTKRNPKNINLGVCCTKQERSYFTKHFVKYQDVLSWTYQDLKTYNTRIVQHIIPMKEDVKLAQQKMRKFHPSLEPQIKSKLRKLLDAKVIFEVKQTTWVANLVTVRKKNGEIRLYVDFRNLNKASKKDNYHVPQMEFFLQLV